MGYRMALSFKNNKRDIDLLEVINSKRDKSNFIKDAIEFFIKYENSTLPSKINNIDITDSDIEQPKETVNVSSALTFMKADEDDDE